MGGIVFLAIETHPEDPWAWFQPVFGNSWGWPTRMEVQLFSDDISLWMAPVSMHVTSTCNILCFTADGLWQNPVWKTTVVQCGVWHGMVPQSMDSGISRPVFKSIFCHYYLWPWTIPSTCLSHFFLIMLRHLREGDTCIIGLHNDYYWLLINNSSYYFYYNDDYIKHLESCQAYSKHSINHIIIMYNVKYIYVFVYIQNIYM